MPKIELPKVKWTTDREFTFPWHSAEIYTGLHSTVKLLWVMQSPLGEWSWGIERAGGEQHAAYYTCVTYQEARKKALTWLAEMNKRPIRLARRVVEGKAQSYLLAPDQKDLA